MELVTLSNLIVILRGKEEVGITFGIACAQSRGKRNYIAKVRIVKAMISLVVMYDCERWTIKEGGK